jgi:hypothetical protein
VNSDRKSGRIVGVLFIIGTVAGVLSVVVTGGLVDGPDYLNRVAANAGQALLGALLVLVMGISLAMVPAVAFPVLKRQNEALAVGYVIFRGALETLISIAVALSWLLLVVVARQSADSGAGVAAQYSSLGTLLAKAPEPIMAIGAIVFSLGALMFYYLLFRASLIPRWISVWGLLGAVPYLAAGLTAFFGTQLETLFMPLALQEMVMAVWLVVKGFSSAVVASRSADPGRMSSSEA